MTGSEETGHLGEEYEIIVFSVLPYQKKILQTIYFCFSHWYLTHFAYSHAKFERVEALLKGQVRCLKTATLSDYDLGVAKKS